MARLGQLAQTQIDASSDAGPWTFTGMSDVSAIQIVGRNLTASTNEEVLLQVSSDNGSTWITTSTYSYRYLRNGSQGNATATGLRLVFMNGSSDFSAFVENFNVAAPIFGMCNSETSGGVNQLYAYRQDAATAWNAFRIVKATQDFTGGTVDIWVERSPLTLFSTLSYPLSGDQAVDCTGYAQVNIYTETGSPAAADHNVQVSVSGTPVGSGYIENNFAGTSGGIGAQTKFRVFDDASPTTQRGFGQILGMSMPVPQVFTGANGTGPALATHNIVDNQTSYTELTSVDDAFNSGSTYWAGVPTT